jgi:hypothetical protein
MRRLRLVGEMEEGMTVCIAGDARLLAQFT